MRDAFVAMATAAVMTIRSKKFKRENCGLSEFLAARRPLHRLRHALLDSDHAVCHTIVGKLFSL